VNHDGIYRLTYANLKKIGISGDAISANTFRLFNGGNEIALNVTSRRTHLYQEHHRLLWKGLNTLFTDTNTYYLTWGGDAGARMTVRDGTVGQGQELTSFTSTIHTEQNTTYWLGMPEPTRISGSGTSLPLPTKIATP